MAFLDDLRKIQPPTPFTTGAMSHKNKLNTVQSAVAEILDAANRNVDKKGVGDAEEVLFEVDIAGALTEGYIPFRYAE